MPIPGPRTQFGPDPGYDNPGGEKPTLFNRWNRPGPIWWPGETPGMMFTDRRATVLAPGQIRLLWRQAVNYIAAQSPYSWTDNAPGPRRHFTAPGGFAITRALRYLTRSLYMGAGIDNTRFDEQHTVITPQVTYKTVTMGAGNTRSRPTVRNRMSSFGSRVPTLNTTVPAAVNPPVEQPS